MKIAVYGKYRCLVNGIEFKVIDKKKVDGEVYFEIAYIKDGHHISEWKTRAFLEHLLIEKING